MATLLSSSQRPLGIRSAARCASVLRSNRCTVAGQRYVSRQCKIDVGRKYRWYIADIDISVSVSYRHCRYRFFVILISYIGDKWNIGNFSILYHIFRLFNVNLETEAPGSKIEHLIWHYDTSLPSLYLYSPKRKLRNNIDGRTECFARLVQ